MLPEWTKGLSPVCVRPNLDPALTQNALKLDIWIKGHTTSMHDTSGFFFQKKIEVAMVTDAMVKYIILTM